MLSSLAIDHEIQLPVRPGDQPVFVAFYSTILRSGKKIRKAGYDGLCAALAEIKAEIDEEHLNEHEVEKKRLLKEDSDELERLLSDYISNRKTRAEKSEALQRQALKLIVECSVDDTGLPTGPFKRGHLVIHSIFIGSGSDRSTLWCDGDEVAVESTAADLLNVIQERFSPYRKLSH